LAKNHQNITTRTQHPYNKYITRTHTHTPPNQPNQISSHNQKHRKFNTRPNLQNSQPSQSHIQPTETGSTTVHQNRGRNQFKKLGFKTHGFSQTSRHLSLFINSSDKSNKNCKNHLHRGFSFNTKNLSKIASRPPEIVPEIVIGDDPPSIGPSPRHVSSQATRNWTHEGSGHMGTGHGLLRFHGYIGLLGSPPPTKTTREWPPTTGFQSRPPIMEDRVPTGSAVTHPDHGFHSQVWRLRITGSPEIGSICFTGADPWRIGPPLATLGFCSFASSLPGLQLTDPPDPPSPDLSVSL
jgi:hypothetical protein